MFFVAGIGVAAFIELLLIGKKNKSASDQVLTLWMFLILVHLFLTYLFVTGDIYRFPFLLGLELPLPLLQAVFLFYYVSFVTRQLPERPAYLLLHLVPAALMYLYLTGFFLLPAELKIRVYANHGAGYELFNLTRRMAITASGIVYVVWSAVLLRRHRRNIRDQYSRLDRVNLQWLQILTIGLGGIWFLVIVFHDDLWILAAMVVFIFLIGFFGVRQTEIFSTGRPEPEKDPSPAGPGIQPQKYTKSGLTEEATADIHRQLLRLMTDEALYKKSDLSAGDLAARLGIHPNTLSQVINQVEKKNFYDFVNTYRIEEFKRLVSMEKNRQFTLLSLAYDCGFSSKSSFNRYFKKSTGRTPSEYAETLQIPQSALT